MKQIETEFRVWDSDSNRMFYDEFFITPEGIAYWNDSTREINGVLMQFIGILDKNGNKIFEGDIVKQWDWGINSNELLGVSEVYWDNDIKGWSLKPNLIEDRYDLFRGVEVIGNIFENPSLIENN